MKLKRWLIGWGMTLALLGGEACQASFVPLGNPPGATLFIPDAISADGSTVVGRASYSSPSRAEAVRWTAAGGWVGLGGLPGGLSQSEANGVSADGSVVVGHAYGLVGGGNVEEAFRWTAAGGMVGLGDLPGGRFNSRANAVSADGSVVVGSSISANSGLGNTEAFRWTEAGGMVGLGDLPGGGTFNNFSSGARAVSADGSVVVGSSSSANSGSNTEAFRWTEAGGMVGLGDLPGGTFASAATAVTPDGSVVVGGSSSASGGQAFRWTAADGMVGLGRAPGDIFANSATAVSADGSVIVGTYTTGLAEGLTESFLWDSAHGMRILREVLIGQGDDLTGWRRLSEARGISADGRTIVGFGLNPSNRLETWVARLDDSAVVPEPSSLTLAGVGTATLLVVAWRRRRRDMTPAP